MTQQSLSGLVSCVCCFMLYQSSLSFPGLPGAVCRGCTRRRGTHADCTEVRRGEFSVPGPWARPGDVDSSSHREQFGARSAWGLLKPWEPWSLQQQVLLEGLRAAAARTCPWKYTALEQRGREERHNWGEGISYCSCSLKRVSTSLCK